MKIYFAASIRGGRDDKEIYQAILGMLQQHGTVLTEHVANGDITHFGESNLSDEQIFLRDVS